MLQSIRDRTHGWIAGVIISLVILSFALWGIHSYMGSSNTDIIAKVNGDDISRRQLTLAFEPLRREMQAQTGLAILPEKVEIGLKREALKNLINIRVIRDAANAQGFRISANQIYEYLYTIPDFQVDGQFSVERFKQFTNSSNMSASDLFEQIRENLLIQQPRFGIILSSFALPNEIAKTVALVKQEREISYMILPLSYFIQQVAEIPQSDIQRYYTAHQDDFKTPEEITIDYVTLSLKDLMKNVKASDEQLQSYYHDNINSYTRPKQWSLLKLFIPLADNADNTTIAATEKKAIEVKKSLTSDNFATIAKQYPDPANQLTGFVNLADLPVELQKAVNTMLIKSGDISDPIKTNKGFVIIKAIEVKPAQVQTFNDVKDKVRNAVAQQQAQETFADLKEKFANAAYEHPDSLSNAAKEIHGNIKTSSSFSKDKGASDISAQAKVREIAFSADVLNTENNSEVINIDPETSVVLRVKSHAPSAILPLTMVQNQIVEKLKSIKAEKDLVTLANEIKQKLANGSSPEKVSEDYHFAWNKAGYIGRYATKVESAILYTAFRMPHPQKLGMLSYATAKVPEGYAIVGLSAVKSGVTDKAIDQTDVFGEQVENSIGLIEYKLYEQSLVDTAKVAIYEDNLTQT